MIIAISATLLRWHKKISEDTYSMALLGVMIELIFYIVFYSVL